MKADYKSLSLANQVYDIIESKILNGVYPPGEILSESRLSMRWESAGPRSGKPWPSW